MRIKKYTAATLQEAAAQMKKELGPDAIILGTRRVESGGVMNFLNKQLLEITAAVDDHPAQSSKAKQAKGFTPSANENYSHKLSPKNGAAVVNELETMTKRFSDLQTKEEPAVKKNFAAENSSLLQDMEEVKSTLNEIVQHIKYSKMPAMPPALQNGYQHLIENDVDENLAADIAQSVYTKLDERELHNMLTVENEILHTITSFIKTQKTEEAKSNKQKIIALVGPTGVGKTTTIAKLAAIKKLKDYKSIGLITADTYRIGAIEQLRTFASIASIQMEVVYRPSEMAEAVRKLKNRDVIFIDTVGRSQRAKKDLLELKRFIDAADPDEIHLVLNTTMSRKVLLDVVERFSIMKTNYLLFSKVDEALSLGNILSIAKKTELPISYVTTGQAVPDDILTAEPLKIAHLIYPGVAAHA